MISFFYDKDIKKTHNIDYKICICCLPAKYAALSRKSKDWLSRNQSNVSEWNDMATLLVICSIEIYRS